MSAGLDTGMGMALEGLKVLDFTWVAVGPITIKYLADNGATVVRVEAVTRRDDLRGAPPYKDGISSINSSQFPAIYNTSKYGLGLNMSKLESQDLIRRMVKEWQPDVVAESFTPVVKKRWGLDYESLKKIQGRHHPVQRLPAGTDGAQVGVCGVLGCRLRHMRASTT